jgi:hypothetical protein
MTLLFCGINTANAQQYYLRKGYRGSNYCNNAYREGKVFVGIKAGVNSAYMWYGDPTLRQYYVPSMINPSPILGMFVEFKVSDHFAIAPTLQYMETGTVIEAGELIDHYEFIAHNINLNVPLYFDLGNNDVAKPYLFIAPNIGYSMGGSIKLDDNRTINLGKSNINRLNYGAKAGFGIKLIYWGRKAQMITRIDAGYNFGLSNTFSSMEIEQLADALNLNMYEINGTRMNRGIEICVSLGFTAR